MLSLYLTLRHLQLFYSLGLVSRVSVSRRIHCSSYKLRGRGSVLDPYTVFRQPCPKPVVPWPVSSSWLLACRRSWIQVSTPSFPRCYPFFFLYSKNWKSLLNTFIILYVGRNRDNLFVGWFCIVKSATWNVKSNTTRDILFSYWVVIFDWPLLSGVPLLEFFFRWGGGGETSMERLKINVTFEILRIVHYRQIK